MEHVELFVFGLLVAVAALAVLARWIAVPYPILLVVGGLGLGLVPGMPQIDVDPDVVLLVFLPPLLYGAAFFTSLRELRANLGPITMLSVGAVAITMVAVAAAAHWIVGLGWGASFVLGAIVSPTDAVAPSTVMRRLGAPRRLLTVVEGENLTNDWTALVLYRFAVAAVVTGTFSLGEASLEFVGTGVGGLAIGLAVARAIREVRRRLDDPPTEIVISLLSSYAAYLPAEHLHVSGVIAAVTCGVYMGWHTPELTTPLVRIQGESVWEILRFLLEATLFLLVGLQMPQVVEAASRYGTGELIAWAAAISGVVIVVRLVWMLLVPGLRRSDRLVVGWCGMRGGVSLAAALALPLTTDAGTFPERDLIVFLAVAVIVVTLVGQGLTLGPLLRRAGVCGDDPERDEETQARLAGIEARLDRLAALEGEDWVNADTASWLRGTLRYRHRGFSAELDGDRRFTRHRGAYTRLNGELIEAERRRLVELRNRGAISDEVRRRIERELDYEQSRTDD